MGEMIDIKKALAGIAVISTPHGATAQAAIDRIQQLEGELEELSSTEDMIYKYRGMKAENKRLREGLKAKQIEIDSVHRAVRKDLEARAKTSDAQQIQSLKSQLAARDKGVLSALRSFELDDGEELCIKCQNLCIKAVEHYFSWQPLPEPPKDGGKK